MLVTGAGGLIGGYMASSFAQKGWQVIATYRNTPPTIAPAAKDNVECLRLDLSDNLDGLTPVDAIIHAAAHTHIIPNSTAQQYISSNVIGTLNLVEYARAHRPAIFVFMSTVSIYGHVIVPELDENTPPMGPGMYGMTKFMGESLLSDHADEFPSVSIRLPGVVGPGSFTPWIGNTLLSASRNEDIVVYNPDSLFNNVVDLNELGRFVSCAIDAGLGGSQAVNLAATKPLPIREVVGMLVSLTGSESRMIEQPTDRRSFLINCAKVKQVFGFEPDTTRSIIHRYVTGNLDELKSGERADR